MVMENDDWGSFKQRMNSPLFVWDNRKPYFPDANRDSRYEYQFLKEALTVLVKQNWFLGKKHVVFADQKLFFHDLITVSDENIPHLYCPNADFQSQKLHFDKPHSVSDLTKALNLQPNSFKCDKKEYLTEK